MPVVDFTAWVTPNLDVTLGGVDYSCPPPSVDQAKAMMAVVVLSEVSLGLSKGPADPELVTLAGAQTDPLAMVTLGRGVHDKMVANGVDGATIDRVGFYALHYWMRGKKQADFLAKVMWSPDAGEAQEAGPKVRRRSKSGPSTASAKSTKTASTRTTESPQS